MAIADLKRRHIIVCDMFAHCDHYRNDSGDEE